MLVYCLEFKRLSQENCYECENFKKEKEKEKRGSGYCKEFREDKYWKCLVDFELRQSFEKGNCLEIMIILELGSKVEDIVYFIGENKGLLREFLL